MQDLKTQLEAETVYLRTEIRREKGFDAIVGQSPAILEVLAQVAQVAPMRHPVSTPHRLKSRERLGGSVARDVVGTAVLPATPEHTDPGAGQDPDRVRMITAAGAGARIDGGGPRRGVTGVVRERREGLAEAFIAGPAEGDAPVFAGGPGDGGDAGFGGELVVGGEAGPVVAEFGEDLGGVDGSRCAGSSGRAGRRVLGQSGRDGRGELLDLGDEGRENRDQGLDEFAAGLGLGVAGATERGAAEPGQQLGGERRPQ